MSFNYLEISRAADEINKKLALNSGGVPVAALTLARFPVLRDFQDLNLALAFDDTDDVLVISLRAPWVGVFWVSGKKLWLENETKAKLGFHSAFSGAPWIGDELVGLNLQSAFVVPGERILVLHFSSGVDLEVELFPAKPNWTLRIKQGKTYTWRSGIERRGAVHQPSSQERWAQATDWLSESFEFYLNRRRSEVGERLRKQAITHFQSKAAHHSKIRNELKQTLERAQQAENYRKQGELLKASLYLNLKPDAQGMLFVPVFEEEGRIEKIQLDPTKNLQENAEGYFQKYKKALRTIKETKLRLESVEEEAKKNTELLQKARSLPPLPDATLESSSSIETWFSSLLKKTKELGFSPSEETEKTETQKREHKKNKKWEKSGARSYFSKEGLKIWIGRNHTENEEIVIRLARGNDMWLHLKNKPGSHGIVQIPKGKSAALETLLDAATLVAHFSGLKEGDRAEVDYTFRKNLKRLPSPKDKTGFFVSYSQNKSLSVTIEKERLLRLVQSS